MNVLRRLRTKIARIAEALEGIDDPTGDYMFALGKRVDKLERKVEYLERQQHSHPGGGGIQPQILTGAGNETVKKLRTDCSDRHGG